TNPDDLHTVTLADLEARVAKAGILISRRQLMRHCKSGTFDAKKLPAFNNQEHWFIAPDSIEKGIADIKTLQEQRDRRVATRLDKSGHDAIKNTELNREDTSGHDATRLDVSHNETGQEKTPTNSVASGRIATDHDIHDHPYVSQLETRIKEKDKVIELLEGQL